MAVPERFRDPVALTSASVFGIAGLLVGVLGPWPWLGLAGPVIALVVLMFTTWRWRATRGEDDVEIEELESELPSDRVRAWARTVADENPARTDADEAVELIGEIENLTLHCETGISHAPETPERDKAGQDVRRLNTFVKKRTENAPMGPAEWSALVKNLRTARDLLKGVLDDLTRLS